MIKYLFLDVDGTLTDGKIYMGPMGETMKAFSIKDGIVFSSILKPEGITPVIITARKSAIVQKRCDELGITEIYQGKFDKLDVLRKIVGADSFDCCAYFGDDILDLECMSTIKKGGGIVGCPADAVQSVKAIASYVCINKAGEGSLREFAEWLFSDKVDEKLLKERVDLAVKYLMQLNITEEDAGKRVVVNDHFYYVVQSYETKTEEQCELESHRKYIDVQIMVSGKEKIGLADISRLSTKAEYNEEKDIILWVAPPRMNETFLLPGNCIVIYPEMAHRGAQNFGGCNHVLKIVGKLEI